MMLWSTECLGVSLLSDKGYRITRQRMARGDWYNAYSPDGGLPIATGGSLERCKHACDVHLEGMRQAGRGKHGKRQLRQYATALPTI